MGIDASPSPEALLRTLAIVILLAAFGYAVLVVGVANMVSPRTLWVTWSIALLCIVVISSLSFTRSFPDVQPVVVFYMTAAFLGIPSGFATWTARRLQREPDRRSAPRRVLRTFFMFLLALPIAFLIGAIPDIAALF